VVDRCQESDHDLEKAYDTVWRDALLVKLHRWGVRGRLLRWLHDFLRDRAQRVCVMAPTRPGCWSRMESLRVPFFHVCCLSCSHPTSTELRHIQPGWCRSAAVSERILLMT
jgi:hypothetical protein